MRNRSWLTRSAICALVVALGIPSMILSLVPAIAEELPHHVLAAVLGDSYSAGVGAGDYTDSECGRSKYMWAEEWRTRVESETDVDISG
jgi:hypothetical protein